MKNVPQPILLTVKPQPKKTILHHLWLLACYAMLASNHKTEEKKMLISGFFYFAKISVFAPKKKSRNYRRFGDSISTLDLPSGDCWRWKISPNKKMRSNIRAITHKGLVFTFRSVQMHFTRTKKNKAWRFASKSNCRGNNDCSEVQRAREMNTLYRFSRYYMTC